MKDKKILYNCELLFKILFLIYAMLSYNSLTYGHKVISLIMWPMILLGGLLILYRVIHFKDYIGMPLLPIMFCFAASFFLSMAVNYRYALKQNIITFIFICFYFFLLYTQEQNHDMNKMKREFGVISAVFVIYMTISVIISIGMLIAGYGNVIKMSDGYEVVSGFVWGRLFGVFLEPNPASVMSIVTILLLIYWARRKKNIVVSVLAALDIFVQALYITFSDSRTAKVCLVIIGFLYVLTEAYRFKDKWNGWKKKTVLVILALAVGMGTSVVQEAMKTGYNYISSSFYADDSEENERQIERNYDLESDPSNRRFDIWMSGLEIFKENKIFGTSYYGIRPYAEENLPDTYIVNNSQTKFRNLHNELLNVLVSQGIIGAAVVVILIFVFLKFLGVRYFKTNGEYLALTNTILLCVICIGISVMFVAAGMFYYNLPSSNMFWMLLGYLVTLINDKKTEK